MVLSFPIGLQKVTVAGSSANSRATPTRLLQLNLTLKGFGQVDDKKLYKTTAQRYTSKDIEISFRPDPHDLDAT